MKTPKLSVSSLKTLQSCEQKYFHYKVAATPKDADYEEGDFLGFGKAFHQVLENTLHTSWNEKLLIEACCDNNVDQDEVPLLKVMLEKYVQYHKLSGVQVVKCELGIETNKTVLYIDAIGVSFDSTGTPIGWWIIDLKTASRHDESLLGRLARDEQMNHYASFADDVEIAVEEIKGIPFLGCRYRQVVKSKATTPRGLESGVKVYDIEIPAEMLSVEEFKSHFNTLYDRAYELHQGEAPLRNYSSCFNYFQPCQYFSQCHGTLFSKSKNRVTVHTIDSLTNGDLL
jgi:hypothetical protein